MERAVRWVTWNHEISTERNGHQIHWVFDTTLTSNKNRGKQSAVWFFCSMHTLACRFVIALARMQSTEHLSHRIWIRKAIASWMLSEIRLTFECFVTCAVLPFFARAAAWPLLFNSLFSCRFSFFKFNTIDVQEFFGIQKRNEEKKSRLVIHVSISIVSSSAQNCGIGSSGSDDNTFFEPITQSIE